MASERLQRQIDRLLDEAEEAVGKKDWPTALDRTEHVLTLDPENQDALALRAAAQRGLAASASSGASGRSAGPLTPAPDSQPSATSHPTSFVDGRYQVGRFLGEGGKKRVYLCHDTRLDRDVAFSLIKTEGLDEAGHQRVEREAQAMGRLGAHPHIVSVFELGEEDGQPFIITELMGGGDVEGLIERAPEHRLPLERVLEIGQQVCLGLEFAHEKGIVHRDLKPGNVWLTADPSAGSPSTREAGSESAARTGQAPSASSPNAPIHRGSESAARTGRAVAKIGDFGLAVAVDRSRLTQAGMMVGTVAYMPPEQALGGEVTPRSDLYSLGAMLYELVTGRPPFVADESVAIITQHLNTPPVAPTWHQPDCPPGLETLILRLLEKDPAKRPASATEVRQALEGVGGQGSGVGQGSTPHPLAPGPQPPGDNPLYRRVFVGREPELGQLQRAFDAALSGQGGLAMVVGEPGIGKTALCEQISTYVAVRGGKTLVGHCYEEGSFSLPYLAFVEAMRTYVLAREPDGLRQDLGTGAAEVARIVSEVRDRVQVELRAPGDPEDDRWRLLQAVTGFLRNAGTVQPLLLVLEDLHWADRGTLDLLLHLARNLEGARLLVVGNYRDVEVDRSHPLSGALADLRRVSSFQRVPLRGLTVDEVHRMMTNIRGQEPSWSRAEAIHRQTEGNPLFVQEVLRYLVEEGLVVREGGRYTRTDGTDPEAGIPEGLRDVIGKRLSKLSPECNRLLATAAVIGRDFALQTLQRVVDVSEEDVLSALEEAARVGVLEERARVGMMGFRFSHALFRQTLYEEIFAPRRIRLHQHVARALEQQYASRLEEHAAELAEHFAQSTDAEDLQKAVDYGEIAAKRAMGVCAYGEAVRLLEQALQAQEVLDPDDKARRCDLLLALGEALMPLGAGRRAFEEVAEEGFELGQQLGDAPRTSRACAVAIEALHRSTRGMAPGVTGEPGAHFGTPMYRKWAERADRHAAPGTRARVLADIALGSIENAAGRQREERAFTARALDLARQLGDPQALFEAGQRMLRGRWSPDGWAEQLALAEEFATHSRAGVSTRPLGLVLGRASGVFLAAGDRGRAEALWEEVEQLAKRTGDAEGLIWPIQIEATRLLLDGELEAALDAAARAGSRMGELLNEPRPLWLQRPRVAVLLYLGRAREALGFLTGGGGPFHAVGLAHAGQGAEARAEVARLLDPAAPLEANGLGYLLEAAVLTGDTDRAAGLAASLDGLTATTTLDFGVHAVGRHLGAAAALLGDKTAAREHYARTLDWATRIRHRPEIALTRLQLAELLLDESRVPGSELRGESDREPGTRNQKLGTREEALAHLDFAVEEFRAMKMQPSLERALRHKSLLSA